MLYANSFSGLLVSFIAASALIYGFGNQGNSQFKYLWWLSISVVLVVRIVDTLYWRRRMKSAYNGQYAIYRYVTGTYFTAILWCVYGITILSDANSVELTSTIIIMSAMASGGATILSAHKLTSIAYATILIAPFSLALFLSDKDHLQYLGWLGLSFCIVMILTAKKAADFTAQAIQLKNENAILVNHMEEQVEQRTQKIYELSNLDPLTKLFNRTAFLKQLDEQLNQAKSDKTPLALLFLDLDGFKKINDTIGHEVGDQLLLQTATRLKQHYTSDQLLCRWGGDEFLIALPNVEHTQANNIAKEIIQHISEPYVFENNRLSIGATVGIALFPQHANNANQLIQLADTAMYHYKKTTPGAAGLFSKDLSLQMQREQSLKEGLALAIQLKQLTVSFQPIIESQTQKVSACEALLRWKYGEENIPPDEFIPIAEQYGLIRKIGAWVMEQACITATQWQENGSIAVAVNVSVIQLQDDDFIDIVDNALNVSGLAPELLHIEMTESVFASDKNVLFQRIKALQNKGIKVSIDDFGTEYSSLAVIQDLGVNIIKIDRYFVQRLSGNGIAIINAIMQIATALGYQVVAEGVETEQQADQLTAMGIDFLQGYFYAKPIDSEHIAPYLQKGPEFHGKVRYKPSAHHYHI